MVMDTKYILLSLPLEAFDSSDKDEALASLQSTLPNIGTILPYTIPSFKIGTLDTLVQQADDLAKIDSACAAFVSKPTPRLTLRLPKSESTDHYITTFVWNKVLYRPDKPLAELVNMLQKLLAGANHPESHKRVKTTLDASFSYLGGNAVRKDKRGNTIDEAVLASEIAAAGLGSATGDYTAYVYYELEVP
ncbi:unnamed protein product [Parascedosporium putredinis]|uniref:V-type proton ATPase subunit C n=1 Tax=Parascedosporium putredinis TaxID=1442378 RepID=A0A9P1MD91_9PEZI|nr:unnamed protein product [Parascedosporium putredinis]CAI7999252.1 unnamed protein product [Parascedosporium putredinis]